MDDPMAKFRKWWPRVVARARGSWESRFAAQIADFLNQDGWQPTAKQLEIMAHLCRSHDAERPEYGEVLKAPDGREFYYSGPVDSWLEVRR